MKRVAVIALLAGLIASTGATSSWGRTARSSDLLEVLPDGNAAAIIDFQKLAGSSLWAAFTSHEKLKGEIDKAQSEIGDLGVKLSDLRTVAIVFPGANMTNPTVALTGDFNQNDLLARLGANGKVKLTSEKYKNYDIYKARSTSAISPLSKKTHSGANAANSDETTFVFHDANTIVLGSAEGVRASIDVKTGAKPGIAKNEKLAAALAQNSAAAIRFALAITPAITGALSSELPIPDFSSVNLVFGTIDVSSGVDLNATLRNDTAEHAKSIADRLNGLLDMAKGYLGSMSDPKLSPIVDALKTVSITSADVDVKVTGNVPMELLNRLLPASEKK